MVSLVSFVLLLFPEMKRHGHST